MMSIEILTFYAYYLNVTYFSVTKGTKNEISKTLLVALFFWLTVYFGKLAILGSA